MTKKPPTKSGRTSASKPRTANPPKGSTITAQTPLCALKGRDPAEIKRLLQTAPNKINLTASLNQHNTKPILIDSLIRFVQGYGPTIDRLSDEVTHQRLAASTATKSLEAKKLTIAEAAESMNVTENNLAAALEQLADKEATIVKMRTAHKAQSVAQQRRITTAEDALKLTQESERLLETQYRGCSLIKGEMTASMTQYRWTVGILLGLALLEGAIILFG